MKTEIPVADLANASQMIKDAEMKTVQFCNLTDNLCSLLKCSGERIGVTSLNEKDQSALMSHLKDIRVALAEIGTSESLDLLDEIQSYDAVTLGDLRIETMAPLKVELMKPVVSAISDARPLAKYEAFATLRADEKGLMKFEQFIAEVTRFTMTIQSESPDDFEFQVKIEQLRELTEKLSRATSRAELIDLYFELIEQFNEISHSAKEKKPIKKFVEFLEKVYVSHNVFGIIHIGFSITVSKTKKILLHITRIISIAILIIFYILFFTTANTTNGSFASGLFSINQSFIKKEKATIVDPTGNRHTKNLVYISDKTYTTVTILGLSTNYGSPEILLNDYIKDSQVADNILPMLADFYQKYLFENNYSPKQCWQKAIENVIIDTNVVTVEQRDILSKYYMSNYSPETMFGYFDFMSVYQKLTGVDTLTAKGKTT